MAALDLIRNCTGFQWDEGNTEKNWRTHAVSHGEAEDVFLNRPLVVADDARHSSQEPHFYALGQTNSGRRMFVAFTIRKALIRVISARDMSRRERKIYEATE